jgi:nucleoside-diphosphate-sugar epimerase
MSVYPHWDARTPTRWRERDFDPAAPWPSVPIEYVQGKRLAEAAVVSESKVEWAVVRPALVMGAGDSTGRTDYWCRPAFDIPREWDRLEFTFAWVDDVARALLAAAADPRAAGGTFNVAHDEPLTLESFFAAFGRPVEYREVDPGADPPPLVNGTLDVSQARERLGWTPTPLASWLPPLVDVNISRDRT